MHNVSCTTASANRSVHRFAFMLGSGRRGGQAVRSQKAYYSVLATKDGTICFAFRTRKPRKTKGSRAPRIDEDGIWRWSDQSDEEVRSFTDWGKGVFHTAVVTQLNMKRILRHQIEPRLEQVEQQIKTLSEQMKRIESKIDRVLTEMGEKVKRS
jgi:hypothetical protein